MIDVFVNSVYVYDDKMVIFFNYKDGEKLVDFESAKEKTNPNPDNHKDYQSSSLSVIGGPSGTRTPDRPVMSRLL